MINRADMRIILDNIRVGTSGPTDIHHDQYDIIDYVTQYRFQGGPEQPIRYLEMKVNKNDIDSAYPQLANSIVEGKTRLILEAVDGGTFVITKIWLNDNTYELVATGIEVTLNTATLERDIKGLDTVSVVKTIFNEWKTTLNLSGGEQHPDEYPDDFKCYFSESYDDELHPDRVKHYISFKEDMPTLVAINMCALLDNAFVFFARRDGVNTLYYVSYNDIKPLAYNPTRGDDVNGVVNIYPQMTSVDREYSEFDLMMFRKLTGVSSKNSEGSETIVNNQIVSVDGGWAGVSNENSKRMYGDYAGAQVMSDRIIADSATAGLIASNIVRRYKDPTRSITFTMSEAETVEDGSYWQESIPVFSYARKIVDEVNRITLVNEHLCETESDKKIDNFMLRLSTFIRYYPEFTSEYTFGVMKETTLSQELANKLTSMSGNLADLRLNGESITDNTGIIKVDSEPKPTPSGDKPHLITSAGVDTALKAIGLAMYPVGSIYLSVNNVNPANLFGGEWDSFGSGRVLVGVDSDHGAGATGGSRTHTITTSEMPAHSHPVTIGETGIWGKIGGLYTPRESAFAEGAFSLTGRAKDIQGCEFKGSDYSNEFTFYNEHVHSASSSDVGGGEAMNIEQPWIGVYMWKRKA